MDHIQLYIAMVSAVAAVVGSTWRLATVLNGVRSDVQALTRRVRRVEHALGLPDIDDDDPSGPVPGIVVRKAVTP